METFVLPVFVAAMIQKVTDLVAFVTAKDWKDVIKQAVAYVTGVVAVAVVKAAEVADEYVLPGFNKTLGDLNAAATVLVGIALASGAGVVRDFINSRDGGSSSYVPPIGGEPSPPA